MKRYSIGVDFGTLSARALLIDMRDGAELATCVREYPHGVLDRELSDGTRLPAGFALARPDDYIDALYYVIRGVLGEADVSPDDIGGIAIDCTANTMLAVDGDMRPLYDHTEFHNNPYAHIFMWKHHAAQSYAQRMTDAANERGEEFLQYYGGRVSSEWTLPKLWQVYVEAPEVYAAAYAFVEVADYMTYLLTGQLKRSAPIAGFKAFLTSDGYPSDEYFDALQPGLGGFAKEKLTTDVYPVGSVAGHVTEEAAKLTGLRAGTPVGVAMADAYVSLPAAGICTPGRMLLIMGTSTCDLLLGDERRAVPGICGAIDDGFMPSYTAYEAGQSCVGDMFNWFVSECVSPKYYVEAEKRSLTIQEYLTELAAAQPIGEHGLIALDWWNGNRSVLVDAELSGLILGMTLTTRAYEIYRALIESTAFGQRTIIDNFTQNGIPVNELVACGGISHKNPFMMQLYADVLGRDIRIARSKQTTALGSAILGAVAAGSVNGGYDTLPEATRAIGGVNDVVYCPDMERHAQYDRLYAEYVLLHDRYGRGGDDVMKRLMLRVES